MKNLTPFLVIILNLFAFTNNLIGQTNPVLVSDYVPGVESGIDKFNSKGIVVNDVLLLPIDDETVGGELGIVTDGTMSILKDIHPSGDANPNEFVMLNGMVFFSAVDEENGGAIWQTDGTAAGTTMFFDPDENNVSNTRPAGLTVSDSGHIFYTFSGNLFRTDGTSTELITSGVSFSIDFNSNARRYSTYEDGVAYMTYNGSTEVMSIYKATDEAVLLAEVENIGTFDDYYGITEVAAGLMFTIDTFDEVGGMYAYNKTDMSLTHLEIDGTFPQPVRSVAFGDERQFGYLSGKGYYSFTGIPSETVKVLDAGIDIFSGAQFEHAIVGDKMIFQTEDVFPGGHEVGITDGTVAGTRILLETTEPSVSNMITVGQLVYFSTGASNSSESEILVYDGTDNSVEVISEFTGSFLKNTQLIAVLGNQLYFAGNLDDDLGFELYSLELSGDVSTNQDIIQEAPVEILLTDYYGELIAPEMDEEVTVEMYDLAGKSLNSFTTRTNTRFDIDYPNLINIVVFRVGDSVVSRKHFSRVR